MASCPSSSFHALGLGALVVAASACAPHDSSQRQSVAGAAWPNEPPGFRVITDWAWDSVQGQGWTDAYPRDLGTNVFVTSDAGAPLSPPSVVAFKYAAGYAGGSAPATVYRKLPNTRELYAGFWWKPSDPWQGHLSNVNKIIFCIAEDFSTDIILTMYGATAPYYLYLWPGGTDQGGGYLVGNVHPNTVVSLGMWHRVELYLRFSATPTSGDGIIRWWLDGTQIGDYTMVNFTGGLIREWQFSPTWGGTGGTKTETDYYWFDHVHLSRR